MHITHYKYLNCLANAANYNNICIFTDILINKDTVRVYNMHLQSIRFGKANYKFLDAITNDTTKVVNEMEESKSIIRLLKKAFNLSVM